MKNSVCQSGSFVEFLWQDWFVQAEDMALLEPEVGAASFYLDFNDFQGFVNFADGLACGVLDCFQLPIVTGPFILCLLVSKPVNKVGKKMGTPTIQVGIPAMRRDSKCQCGLQSTAVKGQTNQQALAQCPPFLIDQ